jgi:hypothetical protein
MSRIFAVAGLVASIDLLIGWLLDLFAQPSLLPRIG